MSRGVPILDTITRPCTVNPIDKYTFKIIITQGLNRQIRRMCEYFAIRLQTSKNKNYEYNLIIYKWVLIVMLQKQN